MRAIVASRKTDLAQIHVLKKQLGLNDDEYRDIMAAVCGGIRSAANLDVAGRAAFLAHLHNCASQAAGEAKRPRARFTRTQALIWSLWMRLADAGAVEHRTMAALDAFCLRQVAVHKMLWLSWAQETAVIEALKAWRLRVDLEAKSGSGSVHK